MNVGKQPLINFAASVILGSNRTFAALSQRECFPTSAIPATIVRFQHIRLPVISHPMTRFLTLTLAILIAVTSQQMAMARGTMMDAAGQVVLCTGHGTKTVTIDHNGEPIDLVHICPDCALTFAATLDGPRQAETPVTHMQTLGQTPVKDLQFALIPTSSQPRGPPRIL